MEDNPFVTKHVQEDICTQSLDRSLTLMHHNPLPTKSF